jgi:hypothetical protein
LHQPHYWQILPKHQSIFRFLRHTNNRKQEYFGELYT